MAIDVERARSETPGCRDVLHLNNAGAALMPQPVIDAQIAHIQREAMRGGYRAEADMQDGIEQTYASIARLLNCRIEEVAVVENATVAWSMAFHAFAFAPGDRILTAEAEYGSNFISYLKLAKHTGASVEVVPSDQDGQLSRVALARMIDQGNVKLISVTHIPTNGGLINPVAEIGRIARAAGVPLLVDACQSVGQLEIDVDAIGCDLLSATGRKYLRGPRGSGFLYVRRNILDRIEPPFLDIRSADWVAPGRYEMRPDARRFENWEFNYAAVLGLRAAVDYALGWGLASIEERVIALGESLRRRLGDLRGVEVLDIGARKCGIVTFSVEGLAAEAIGQALGRQAINVSLTGRASTLLDFERRGLPELMVRASVHYYNSEDELDRFAAALEALIDRSS
ncbi:MAG: aminotransferase class V-fold PLP-dependent enzyme [Proteobacteria bacterium]|nr:aminotransferase class V-fold PLP-dependent enzyme [Pseudomonadota bacterium]